MSTTRSPRRMPRLRRHLSLFALVMLLLSAFISSPLPFAPRTAAAASVGAELLIPTWGATPGGIWHYTSSAEWQLQNAGLPAGWYWKWIAADPSDAARWLLLGNTNTSDDFSIVDGQVAAAGTTTSPLFYTADAGVTWTPISMPTPGAAYAGVRLFNLEFRPDAANSWSIVGAAQFPLGFNLYRPYLTIWSGSGAGVTSNATLDDVSREPIWGVPGLNGETIVTTYRADLLYLNSSHAVVKEYGENNPWIAAVRTYIEKLPGVSTALVGANQGEFGFSVGGIRVSPDYQSSGYQDTALGNYQVPYGAWVAATSEATYVGGRGVDPGNPSTTGGVLQIADLFGSAAATQVYGGGSSIGFIRADRQTRTAVAALARQGDQALVYLKPELGAAWQTITAPANSGLADRLEVLATRPLGPALSVSVDAPTKLDVSNGQYTPNPFTVTATVRNQGTDVATDVRLTLTLPAGLTLVRDAPLKGIGVLPAGESRQVEWSVSAAAQGQETTLTYTVVAAAVEAQSRTVTQQITVPRLPFTTSYYMQTKDTDIAHRLGCLARRDGAQGIVVLDFGHPRNLSADTTPVYATQFVGLDAKATLPEIAAAVEWFALGYIEGCDPETYPRLAPARLIIAIGTDNSKVLVDEKNDIWQDNPGLTRGHGEAWARMVTQVNDWLKQEGYYGAVQAAGAYDAEFGAKKWASSGTFEWAEGYDSQATAFYYNYGACESCPRTEPRDEWTDSPDSTDPNGLHSFAHVQSADRVFKISWEITHALPLPQIYLKPYAQEWYNVRRYAREQGRSMTIQGVMTECQSSSCNTNDTRPWMDFSITRDLPPRQGWQALYDTLNAPLAPDGSPNVVPQPALAGPTDITFQPVQ